MGRKEGSRIGAILAQYYGDGYRIDGLLGMRDKIVFLNPMVHPSESQEDDYYFGSICSNITKPRKSMCNPLVRESTY